MVGRTRLELVTSAMSRQRSNQPELTTRFRPFFSAIHAKKPLRPLEARAGIEPAYEDLQSPA